MCQYQVNILPSIIFLVITIASSATFAAMYKWVDEEGITQYTQHPPSAGIESKTLKPPATIDSSEAAKTLKEQLEYLDTEREKRQKFSNAKQREEDEKARQEKNCETARTRLTSLTNRPRVLVVHDDGSRTRPTEEERQEEIAKSKKVINEYCK